MSTRASTQDSDAIVPRAIAIVSRWIATVAAVLTVLTAVLSGAASALGVAGGGALACLTWMGSALCARRVASTEGAARLGWSMAFAIVCSLAFGGAAALVGFAAPGSGAIGFGALVIGVILGAIEAWARLDRA